MKVSIVVISKNEPALAETLESFVPLLDGLLDEVVVVDASGGRLDFVRDQHRWVKWVPFTPRPDAGVTIPEQRNLGVAEAIGEVIVFTDCGCVPERGWLPQLLAPILSGRESVTCGRTASRGRSVYEGTPDGIAYPDDGAAAPEHVEECPTINMAFRREVFERVGGFDESFQYGSDIDFSWRLTRAGTQIRYVPEAVVVHDWGDSRRQTRRAISYGRARAHLYRKHPDRIAAMLRKDPISAAYPLFLLGLPLTLKWRAYPLLLVIPLWRNRGKQPVRVVVDHLWFGVGVLRELASPARCARVKVLVLPRDENPYQGHLYGAMDPDVEVRYLDGPTSSQTLNLLALPFLLVWHRVRGFRLLHVHWVHPFLLAWARSDRARGVVQRSFELFLDFADALGYRIVWTAHNLLPHDRVFRDDAAARRVLMEHSDAVITHSRHTATELAAWGTTRVVVIPQGADRTPPTDRIDRGEARRILGLDPSRTVVLFFGKVLEYKGVDALIDAVGTLPSTVPIDVLVVGLCRDDELRRDLIARAAWAGQRVRTRFEFVPDPELAVYLAAADVAVFPFRTVTNSSSVATALGAGLPVIVPRLPSLDELPDDVGIRYEPGAPGLTDALLRAVEADAPVRARWRAGAERLAAERTWTAAAAATRRLYGEVLGAPVTEPAGRTGLTALFVTPYPPKPDGIGAHTRELVAALGQVDGMEVEVLTSRRPVGSDATPGVHRVLAADPRCTADVAARIGRVQPDILHYQFAIPAFGLAAVAAIRAGVRARRADPNLRIVITLHEVSREINLLGPVGLQVYRTLVAIADAVIVHTTEARDLVVRKCGADPQRVWLTPLGATPPPVGSLAPDTVAAVQARYHLTAHEPGGRPLALCFGYLHTDKGIEHLVEAVARLHRRGELPAAGLDVLVTGTVRPRSGAFRYFERRDREYELALRRAVEHHGLTECVRFVGFVDSDDVPALFAAARVVVVPYTKVTQSSVLGMATVAGAPVVASDLPGLREALGDGGLLVPPADPDALAAALLRVLTDDALAAKLRDAQKQRGAETGFDVVASELVDIYDAVRTTPARAADRRTISVR